MVDAAVEILDCDREQLLDDFKKVHQYHQDVEHPFGLLETNTVRVRYPNMSRRQLAEVLDGAFHAFNSERKKTLRLYDGVQNGLDELRSQNIAIVAHTEGKLFSVLDRLRRLDLLKHFSKIYCRERSESSHVKAEVGSRWLDNYPMDRITELSHHQRKPNPEVLAEICAEEKVSLADSLYVGDSIARDVVMAKTLGVRAAWAKYGTHHDEGAYAALIRISHWTDADVERELELKRKSEGIAPDIVLEKSFSDLIDALRRDA
jgi:phosphoglycolate phosphatase